MTHWGQPDRAISGVGGFMAAALCAVISGTLMADMFGDPRPAGPGKPNRHSQDLT